MSLIADLTSPYSAAEAWLYDRLIAPALAQYHPRFEARLLEPLRCGDRVLEVGCGGGQLALHLTEARPDLRIVGLDLSPGQVERATARARGLEDRVEFMVGNALDLPFGDQEFHAVMSLASIKHWPDPAAGLRECVRVLKPGGLLAVAEVDRGCRYDDAREFVRSWHLPAPLRPGVLLLFRTLVAGRSFDLDETRALAATLPLEQVEVTRIEGTPALLLSGRKI